MCNHAIPHPLTTLAGKHSGSLVIFFNQFAKISSGPIKMLYQCNLYMLWSIAVRETGRMAASCVTRFIARNPELPRPAGMREQNPILGVNKYLLRGRALQNM